MKEHFASPLAWCLVAFSWYSWLRAGTISSRIVWEQGRPFVEISVDAQPVEGIKDVAVPCKLSDAKGQRIWSATLRVPVEEKRPWRKRFPLDVDASNPRRPRKVDLDPRKQYRVDIDVLDNLLGLDYHEDISFTSEKARLRFHGFRFQGMFPQRRCYLVLGVNAFKGRDLRQIPVSISLRDREENAVFNRESFIQPAHEPAEHLIDITPDTSASIGPFTVDVAVESEGYGIYFSTSRQFAFSNALLPVSSMEHGDTGAWFASAGAPPDERSSLRYYYSPHLQPLRHASYPAISYDEKHAHSGRQSLRIDYKVGQTAHAWASQVLPGKPRVMRIWVRGNGSDDRLIVTFQDHINHTLPAWHRNANFAQKEVCKLNFTGWRQFRVPVLGDGL